MMLTQDALEKAILKDFPIAKAMSIRVKETTASHVSLEAPLAANTNHENTAFGGSVYSVAVLSCWALVSQSLKEWGFDVDYVVVQDGHIDYTVPVAGDFEATSSWASEREAQKFRTMLTKKGLARASLTSTVRSQGRDCATMEGRFAARIEL
jgi:thioesterase domain-containing protein